MERPILLIHTLSYTSKYYSQHPVLTHPRFILPLRCETKFYGHKKQQVKLILHLHFTCIITTHTLYNHIKIAKTMDGKEELRNDTFKDLKQMPAVANTIEQVRTIIIP